MIAIFTLVLSFNTFISSEKLKPNTLANRLSPVRSMASVRDDRKSMKIKKKLINHLSNRKIASFSESPSSFDKFRFGFLEGKYSVRLDKGQLSEIEFALSVIHGDHPKSIVDKGEFFMKYKDLFNLKDYEHLVKKNTISTTDAITETYELFNSTSVSLAEVQFQTDIFGRLLKMQIRHL